MTTQVRPIAAMLIAVVVGSLLTFTPSRASAADGEMSVEQAGQYYLKTICSANRVENSFYKKVFGKRQTMPYKAWKGKVLRAARKAAPKSSRSDYRAGRRLAHPPAPWPSEVAGRVDRISGQYLQTSDQYDQIETLGRRGSFRALGRLYDIGSKSAKESKRIRAALNLPSNGEGC